MSQTINRAKELALSLFKLTYVIFSFLCSDFYLMEMIISQRLK